MNELELTDFFAGQYMNAIYINDDFYTAMNVVAKQKKLSIEDVISKASYSQAIAMVKERNRLQQKGIINLK